MTAKSNDQNDFHDEVNKIIGKIRGNVKKLLNSKDESLSIEEKRELLRRLFRSFWIDR